MFGWIKKAVSAVLAPLDSQNYPIPGTSPLLEGGLVVIRPFTLPDFITDLKQPKPVVAEKKPEKKAEKKESIHLENYFIEKKYLSPFSTITSEHELRVSLDSLVNNKEVYLLGREDRKFLAEKLVRKANFIYKTYGKKYLELCRGFYKAAAIIDENLSPDLITRKGVRRLSDNSQIYSFNEVYRAIGIEDIVSTKIMPSNEITS